MIKLARAGLAAGIVASTVLAGVSAAAPKPALPVFDKPVLLTPVEGFGGFEPSLVVDAKDNIWATAHRTDGAISPDGDAAAGARSGSWLWFSPDGKKFTNPRTTGVVDTHETAFGIEGDLAADSQGNVHFVDLGGGRSAFSSWKTEGPGKVTAVRSTPALTSPTVDRPFISVSGDTVLLAVHDFVGTPLAPTQADLAAGQHQGQYSFYISKDGGGSFSLTGVHPPESAFCRPHVSPRNTQTLVAACTSFVLTGLEDEVPEERFFAYVSRDHGATWKTTHLTKPFPLSQTTSFPSVAETPDGRIHMLFTQMSDVPPEEGDVLATSALMMTSSADGGRTWSRLDDVSPEPGLWQHASLAADRTGKLGIAGYYQKATGQPWRFRAATWDPKTSRRVRDVVSTEVVPGLVSYSGVDIEDGAPQGEFTQAAFDSRGKLNVIFNVRETAPADAAGDGKRLSSSKVFFARQR